MYIYRERERHTHTHLYIYIYIYAHTYIYTHIDIHTYIIIYPSPKTVHKVCSVCDLAYNNLSAYTGMPSLSKTIDPCLYHTQLSLLAGQRERESMTIRCIQHNMCSPKHDKVMLYDRDLTVPTSGTAIYWCIRSYLPQSLDHGCMHEEIVHACWSYDCTHRLIRLAFDLEGNQKPNGAHRTRPLDRGC